MHTWSDEEHSDMSWHSDCISNKKNKTSRESLFEVLFLTMVFLMRITTSLFVL